MAPPPVWLVTGASRGIGQEHARQAVQAGHTVLAACRTPSKATELQHLVKDHPGQLHLLTLDVTNESSMKAAAAEAVKLCPHGIDVLINNAGITGPLNLASQTEADHYLEVLMVNVVGPVLVTKHFLPLLRKSSVRPKIVNISSMTGSLTRLQDVTVISLCPGFVATDLNADVRKDEEMEARAMKPAVSVTQQLKVIEKLKPEDSGLFFGHQGEKYPW